MPQQLYTTVVNYITFDYPKNEEEKNLKTKASVRKKVFVQKEVVNHCNCNTVTL